MGDSEMNSEFFMKWFIVPMILHFASDEIWSATYGTSINLLIILQRRKEKSNNKISLINIVSNIKSTMNSIKK